MFDSSLRHGVEVGDQSCSNLGAHHLVLYTLHVCSRGACMCSMTVAPGSDTQRSLIVYISQRVHSVGGRMRRDLPGLLQSFYKK